MRLPYPSPPPPWHNAAMHWFTRALLWLSALPLPLLALSQAQHGAFGRFSVDLAGHLWTGWSAARGPLTRSPWIGFPDGVDLMPIVGGWLDVWLVGLLSPALGLVTAYNLTCALYGVVVGLGGQLLARSIGASALSAGVAGLLLQLDPFILHHLMGGRRGPGCGRAQGLGWAPRRAVGAAGASRACSCSSTPSSSITSWAGDRSRSDWASSPWPSARRSSCGVGPCARCGRASPGP